jgi:hypothetical protein
MEILVDHPRGRVRSWIVLGRQKTPEDKNWSSDSDIVGASPLARNDVGHAMIDLID